MNSPFLFCVCTIRTGTMMPGPSTCHSGSISRAPMVRTNPTADHRNADPGHTRDVTQSYKRDRQIPNTGKYRTIKRCWYSVRGVTFSMCRVALRRRPSFNATPYLSRPPLGRWCTYSIAAAVFGAFSPSFVTTVLVAAVVTLGTAFEASHTVCPVPNS